jgi:hypothetical protein
MLDPEPTHWTAVKHIFHYLKGTRDFILTLRGRADTVTLTAYCDSDFGMSKDHRQSIAGSVLFLSQGCFHWLSKKQEAVAFVEDKVSACIRQWLRSQ